jgi:hypothetical protein
MIYIEKVRVILIEAGTVANPDALVYGGLIVDYRQNDMEGQVRLDIPENVAMNLTLNDIRERVVLKLREVQ